MLPSPQRGYHERTSNNQQLARRIARLSPARRALLEQRLLGSRKPAAPVRAVPKAPSGDCPLTHVQRQVWAFERLYPGTPAYNVIWVKALHGPIDFPALERAFNALLGRHAILRATFHSTPDGPVQRIQPPAPAPLQHLFVEAGAADSQAAAREIARGEADRAFDLERGPLARATLIRVTVEEHWLLLTAHHLVADGWSMGVAERDLAELYNGFRQAREPNLPSLPIEYADWAAWLSTHETDTAYWVNELDGASHEPGLHTDFARTPNSLPAGVNPAEAWKAGVTVPRPLLAALESTARACDATVYALLIAAWAAVLHRHGCGEDLMIGTPLAGRTRPDLANVVGFFANTLPLRIGIQGDPTFAGLVARVKQKVLAAVDRQDAPVTPGFQTAVAYLESHPSQHLFSGLRTEHLLLDNRSAPFDTMLFADQFAGQLALTVALRKHIFGESTCITIARHLERFLEGIATDPGLPVSAYPLMDAEERRAVLALSGGNTRPYSREPVHVLFERQAALTPESVALVDGGRTVTYAELGRHSTHIAAAIAQAGVGPGSIVAVLCDGSSAMVAAFLGVMKAGAAYLPLDIADPQLRLRQLVREANARLVLTPGCERFPGVDTLLLNQLPEAKTVPPAEITPDSPAYVMYTSGSTGVPKAVVVPHRGIGRLVRECSFARLDPSTVCLHMAPPAFDASTFEIWAPLLNGGLCVLYSGSRASLADIGDAIRRHGVNTLWLTSSLFNAVIDEAPQMLAPIRQLLIGGEVLSVPHVTKALRALPATRIVNGYGPTECTTFACCYPIPHDIDPNSASIPIGTPIASTSAYILDGRGEPVPLGVPGELYLGGDGVALGYLGQPELTNEVFLPDPFHPGTHHIYKTGDRARWLPSGVIEFLGRADGQLKIRGFRVEPGEVEAALLALPSIAQAAVAVQDGSSGAKHLIAYVVPSAQAGTGRGALEAGRNSPPQLRCAGEDLGGSGQADSESIRAALSHRLPAYMVPARIAIIDRLPLRDNGKIDRARLPAIQHTRAGTRPGALEADRNSPPQLRRAGEYIGEPVRSDTDTPLDQIERGLLDLWRELLNAPEARVNSDFFLLGGDSLLAIRLVARIETRFQRALPVATVFAAPTVRKLAEVLRATGEDPGFVIIAPGRSECPIVWLDPGRSLQHLGTELTPHHALHSLTLTPAELAAVPAPHRLEDLAALLADKLDRRRPGGPTILASFCLRTFLAVETARELRSRGHRVPLVVLADPSDPETVDHLRNPASPSTLTRRARVHLRRLRETPVEEWSEFLAGRGEALLVRLKQQFRSNPVLEQPILAAGARHRFEPYDGALLLVRIAPEEKLARDEIVRSWSRIASGLLTVRSLSGGHIDMFDPPHVAAFAQLLREEIASLSKGEVVP